MARDDFTLDAPILDAFHSCEVLAADLDTVDDRLDALLLNASAGRFTTWRDGRDFPVGAFQDCYIP